VILNPRPAIVPLCLGALAASASAQSTFTFELTSCRTIAWAPSGVVSRSASGELTGDARMDAVFLDGNDVYLIYAPERHTAVIQVNSGSTPANDVAVLPSPTAGEPGDVVAVGSAGLYKFEFSYATSGYYTSSAIGGSSAWNHAQRLEVADVNRDGYDDVVGLNEGGGKLLVTHGPSFSSTSQLSLGTLRAKEFCTVSWTDVGAGDLLEMAILVPEQGIFVLAADGSSGASLSRPTLESGALVALTDGGAVGTHLAIVAVHDDGEENLITYRPSGDEELELTETYLPYGIVAGDVDGDGDDDVGIAHTGNKNLYLFINQTFEQTGPTFTESQIEAIDMRKPYEDVQPLLADFQGSGLPDLLSFSPDDDLFSFYDNTNPDVNLGPPMPDVGIYYWYTEEEMGELELQFESLPSAPTPSSITHLQVTQWLQGGWGYNGVPSSPPPMQATAAVVDLIDYASLQAAESLHVFLEDALETTDKLHYLELRFVEVDGSGNVVRVNPSLTMAFYSNLEQSEVMDEEYPGEYFFIDFIDVSPNPSGPGYQHSAHGSKGEGETGSTRTPDIPDPDEPVPDPDGTPGSGGSGSGGNG